MGSFGPHEAPVRTAETQTRAGGAGYTQGTAARRAAERAKRVGPVVPVPTHPSIAHLANRTSGNCRGRSGRLRAVALATERPLRAGRPGGLAWGAQSIQRGDVLLDAGVTPDFVDVTHDGLLAQAGGGLLTIGLLGLHVLIAGLGADVGEGVDGRAAGRQFDSAIDRLAVGGLRRREHGAEDLPRNPGLGTADVLRGLRGHAEVLGHGIE